MRRPRGMAGLLPALTVLNLAFIGALWACQRFVAERFWLGTLLTYLPQGPFLLPSFVLLAWSLARRRRRALLVNAAALLLAGVALLGFNVPSRRGTLTDAPVLRVMTYNIHHGVDGVPGIAAVVQREHPDVVCLQETNATRRRSDPIPPLAAALPGWHVVHRGEMATLSRVPVRSVRAYPSDRGTGRVFLQTDVEVDKVPVTVINVHFATAATPRRLVVRPHLLPDYLRRTAAVRSAQVESLLGIANAAPVPLVIAGDFNTPPRGILYQRLNGVLQDAFGQAGWGFGYTFRSDLPLLRIDYVLTRGTGDAERVYVPSTSASDHRPVVADVVLAP